METESKLYVAAKWGIGLTIAWALSGVVLAAVKGIVGLAVCVAIGVAAIEVWPLFQFTLRKGVIGMFKWFAKRDPIGALQTVELERTRDLARYQEETVQIEAETTTFARMVEKIEHEYPDDPETNRLRDQLQMLRDTVADRRVAEAEFAKALVLYRATIEKMQAMWSASQAGNRASRRANVSKKQYQRLVEATSFDAVEHSMAEASARLAASRARSQEQRAALPPASTPTLAASVREAERVVALPLPRRTP